MFLILISLILLTHLKVIKVFLSKWYVLALQQCFAQKVQYFIFIVVTQFHFGWISKNTFFMDLKMSNEIFIIQARLPIIFVSLKLKDQVQQVFIPPLQGFYLPFYFYHLQDLLRQYPFFNNKNTVFGWILPPINFLFKNSIV